MKSKKKDIREAILKILDLILKINSLSDNMVFFAISPHVDSISVKITTSNYLEVIERIDIYYDWEDSLKKLRETERYLEKYLNEI